MTSERCVLCGEMIAADDPDAVEVGGGLAHEECLVEHDDEPGLFEPDPECRAAATGRTAASFECSTYELERMARSARRAKERRNAGEKKGDEHESKMSAAEVDHEA